MFSPQIVLEGGKTQGEGNLLGEGNLIKGKTDEGCLLEAPPGPENKFFILTELWVAYPSSLADAL